MLGEQQVPKKESCHLLVDSFMFYFFFVYFFSWKFWLIVFIYCVRLEFFIFFWNKLWLQCERWFLCLMKEKLCVCVKLARGKIPIGTFFPLLFWTQNFLSSDYEKILAFILHDDVKRKVNDSHMGFVKHWMGGSVDRGVLLGFIVIATPFNFNLRYIKS